MLAKLSDPGRSVPGMTASPVPLYDLDPCSLTPEQRVDALLASECELARLSARQQRIIAAISDDPFTGELTPALDKQYFLEQVRATLGDSLDAVRSRVAMASDLVHRLPDALAALEAGVITSRQAWRLTVQLRELPDTAARKVQEAVLDYMQQRRDHSGFCRKVKREVLKHDPRGAEERHTAAMNDRRVTIKPVEDAMTWVGGTLPAPSGGPPASEGVAGGGGIALDAALDLLAEHAKQTDPDDGRTKAQRRADALAQLARDVLAGQCVHCTGTPAGLRPAVQVSVALSTLLGIDHEPAELAGYGPIPASLALHLAFDHTGTWRRLLTDPQGHLLDYGRSTYRPPAALRDYVIARDRTCRFPGFPRRLRLHWRGDPHSRRAESCEVDHVTSWADGGTTSTENLVPLCTRDHHCKHDTGWNPTRLPDGTLDWTDPTGHHHRVPPATYPIDHTLEIVVPNDNAEHSGEADDGDGDGANGTESKRAA